jgi:hypothetical protein
MRSLLIGLVATLVLAGCAATAPTLPPDAPATRKEDQGVHAGDTVVSVVGTPFYLIFKGAACIASVAIAAPTAGLGALSDSTLGTKLTRNLGDGVNWNCGPPYVLTPSRVASATRAQGEPTPPTYYAPAPEPEQPPGSAPGAPKPLFDR